MPCATHSCLWCDFDAVSSRLPPPFPSFQLSSLVASAVTVVARFLLFVISFFLLLQPSRYYASAFPHVNRLRSPALHPVFQQLVPTAVGLLLHPVVLVVLRYSPLMVFVEGARLELANTGVPARLLLLHFSTNLPYSVCCDIIAAISNHHTHHWQYSGQSHTWDMPNDCRASYH